jgi:hypothetical protein
MIRVRYTEPDGATGIINHLTADNTELSGATGPDRDMYRAKLLDKATRFASEWGKVYPDTKFTVEA